jgi:tetratricopeptide (TPR) repeat protein
MTAKTRVRCVLLGVAGLIALAAAARAGQAENPVAALEQRLAVASEKDQIGILNELAALLARRDPRRALELGRRALGLAEQHKDVRGQAFAHKNLGLSLMVLERSAEGLPHMQRANELFTNLGDRPETARTFGFCGIMLSAGGKVWPAINAGQGALAIFRELGDTKGTAAATNNLGVLFNTVGDYQKALEYNLESLRLEESLGRKIGIANNLNSVGNIYSQLRDHLKARDYYVRALPLFEELGEKAGTAKVLNNIGNTYEKLEQDGEALKYFERALAIGREIKLRVIEADALNNMGIVFKKRQRYDDALSRYFRVVELKKEIGGSPKLADTYHNIADIYLLEKRPDDALAYLEKALAIGKDTRSNEALDTVYLLMAQCFEAKGDYRKAYENQVLSSEARAAMLDQQRNRTIAELQEKYEADARKRQIELLGKDNDLLKKDGEIRRLELGRTRLLAGLLLAVSGLAVGAILLLFRRFRYLVSFWRKRSYVGHYKIVDTIASGGMGVVYRAVDVSHGARPFAVKVIRDELSDDPMVRKRFINEAAIVDQLHHPNIVRIFERGEHDGKLFIAMELLDGPSLADVIKRGEAVPIRLCLDVMAQLADAIAKIHSKGIVHRDLKPENVMLVETEGSKNVVKLLDFGLATTQSLTRLTQTGMILGTIAYLPPEQITDRSVTAASDLYSLGVIAYELLTLQKPFLGETPVDIIKHVLDHEPEAPARIRADIPGPLNDLVLEMMSKDPASRPSDAALAIRIEELRLAEHAGA